MSVGTVVRGGRNDPNGDENRVSERDRKSPMVQAQHTSSFVLVYVALKDTLMVLYSTTALLRDLERRRQWESVKMAVEEYTSGGRRVHISSRRKR